MKKLLVGLLTAACAISAVFGLAACDGGKDGADGVNGINGTNGKDGNDGVGIKNTEINDDGELVITLSDGTVKNLGVVVGADGNDGADGKNGSDGIGIKEVKFNEDGSMSVIFTDDSTKDLGKIPYCKHNFSEWETVLEATCTSIGYGTRECDICGYVEYKFEEAKGHIWDDGIYFSGRILETCTVCNAVQFESIENSLPFILPIENAKILKIYGSKYDYATQRWVNHFGLDFDGEEGTSVRAVLAGKITQIVSDHNLGENYVAIEHFDGMITTYKYIVASSNLKVGDTVRQGDIIGTVAPAGGMEKDDGEHLHFELKADGVTVDPVNYFNPDDLVYADGIIEKPPVPDNGEKEPELSLPDISGEQMILPVENGSTVRSHDEFFTNYQGQFELHKGIDLRAEEGTSVRAVHSGVVTKIVSDNASGENYVTISHSGGMTTTYKYIVVTEDLKEGDTVNQGDIIGTVAAAGGFEKSLGAHLHFEVAVDGKAVDPEQYFENQD